MYSKLIAHIRATDFNDLNNAIKSLALNGLRHVIDSNAGEFDCIDQIKNRAILYQESLNIILTGQYAEPVFDMCLDIYETRGIHLGYYRYIVDTNFKYVDEFLVLE